MSQALIGDFFTFRSKRVDNLIQINGIPGGQHGYQQHGTAGPVHLGVEITAIHLSATAAPLL